MPIYRNPREAARILTPLFEAEARAKREKESQIRQQDALLPDLPESLPRNPLLRPYNETTPDPEVDSYPYYCSKDDLIAIRDLKAILKGIASEKEANISRQKALQKEWSDGVTDKRKAEITAEIEQLGSRDKELASKASQVRNKLNPLARKCRERLEKI